MSDFPVLDAPRTEANRSLGRVVFDVFGDVEPFIEEVDSWVSLPLRLTHDQAGGWQLELGIYTLDAADVYQLRAAIAAYDLATRGNSAGVSR